MTLHGQYIAKILYDYETRATAKLYRIVSIQFIRSYTATRLSCWEATCEPVVRDPATGNFGVPKDVLVTGSNVTLTHALQGYCLAEYTNGLEAEPSYLPWVQMYVDTFETSSSRNFRQSWSTRLLLWICHPRRTYHPLTKNAKPPLQRTCHPYAAHSHAARRTFQWTAHSWSH